MSVIVIGGMIGVGKSTYAEMIGKHLDSEVFYESVDDNPVLPLFYKDPKRYGFLLQIYFLTTRFASIKEALRHRHNVLDRSIYEDALFVQVNNELGNITDAEKQVYDKLLEEMMEEIEGMPKKAPDLFVYVRGSFDTVLARIKKRGRGFEQDKELVEYYRFLHSKYDDWVYKHYDASAVLTIDGDKFDVTRKSDAEYILTLIDAKMKELGICK